MRDKPLPVAEKGREKTGPMASREADGCNGRFLIQSPKAWLLVVASNGLGWDHVSVSVAGGKRCPTWSAAITIGAD